MARVSIISSNQYFDITAGNGGSPYQSTPLTLMVDFIPLTNTASAVLMSVLADTPTSAGGWDGWYLGYGTSTVSATTVANNVFTGSAGVPCTQSTRHLATAVFRSPTSRQVYCDGRAGAISVTSSTPTATPNHLSVAAAARAANNSPQTDNFMQAYWFSVMIFNYAVDFQQHLQIWRTGSLPQAQNANFDNYITQGFWRYDFNWCITGNAAVVIPPRPTINVTSVGLNTNNGPGFINYNFGQIAPKATNAPGGITASGLRITPSFFGFPEDNLKFIPSAVVGGVDSLKKNVAGQNMTFSMISAGNGTPLTGLTITVYVTKDNAPQTTGAGTVTEKGGGQYDYTPTQAETNATDVGFLFTSGGAVPYNMDFHTDIVDSNSLAEIGIQDLNSFTLGPTNLGVSTQGICWGTVGNGSTTSSIVVSSLNNPTSLGSSGQLTGRTLLFLGATTTPSLQSVYASITASTTGATPTLTVTPLPATPVSGDTFVLL